MNFLETGFNFTDRQPITTGRTSFNTAWHASRKHRAKKTALLFRLGFATLPLLSGMKNDL
jgi:hypothetical protein